MDPSTRRADALGRAVAHLAMLTRGRETPTLYSWRRRIPELAMAPITDPMQLPEWLRGQPTLVADEVLRGLVAAAQDNDHAAMLMVVVCLSPGIRTLANRIGISPDEAVSEVALGVFEFPCHRRRVVAAGLLLDARNRVHRNRQRARRNEPLGRQADGRAAPDDSRPAAVRIVQLVCDAHRDGVINQTDAELIIQTRVGGHNVRPVAERLGLSPSAAYQRRQRAETRLAELVA